MKMSVSKKFRGSFEKNRPTNCCGLPDNGSCRDPQWDAADGRRGQHRVPDSYATSRDGGPASARGRGEIVSGEVYGKRVTWLGEVEDFGCRRESKLELSFEKGISRAVIGSGHRQQDGSAQMYLCVAGA
jgi:hypothetical protein